MNKEFPMVSAVMATCNRALLLERALSSIFLQTYPNLEVVILDDTSEDETPRVIDSFASKHPNLRAFREKAGGTSRAIRQVTKKARGEYIAQLDDDDFWSDPEKTALQAAFLEQHSDYVAVGGGVVRINGEGRERARYLLPETDEDIRRAMMWYTPMAPIATMIRRSAWEEAGGTDVAVTYADDWDLAARLGRVGKFYNLQRYVATYTKEDVRWNASTARRLELESLSIRRRYRKEYPGFWKGSAFGAALYLSTFIPLQCVWRPLASRLWNVLRTRFL